MEYALRFFDGQYLPVVFDGFRADAAMHPAHMSAAFC
jgi:hypothetical protein